LLEFALYFVLIEALCRRLIPAQSTAILAVKFVVFPAVYCLALATRSNALQSARFPTYFVPFLAWGTLTTFIHFTSRPVTSSMGLAVNALFVPVAYFSAAAHRMGEQGNSSMRHLGIFAGLGGILAACQSQLPSSHWLRVGMRGEAPLEGRVTGPLQFCNTYGSFGILGTIVTLAWYSHAVTRTERVFAFLAIGLNTVGLWLSGSRTGSICSFVVIVLWVLWLRSRFGRVLSLAITASALVLVAHSTMSPLGNDESTTARSLRTTDLRGRVEENYVYNAVMAAQYAGLVGTGWGPFTMGVGAYGSRLGADADPDVPTLPIEGGYAAILAQTGLIGFILFLGSHLFLLKGVLLRSYTDWLGISLAVWSLLGTLPAGIQDVPALAVPFWFVVGIYLSARMRTAEKRSVRPAAVASPV
jgi:O-antigen ligase